MLIPVREYRRREMFCENCRPLGHTKKFCANKKLENPTYLCMQCQTNNHLGGSNQCPRRKVLEKKNLMTMRKLRKRTFAEILKELDPNGEAHESSDNATVRQMSFPSRKEEVAQKKLKHPEPLQKTPKTQKPQKSSSSATNKYPPGFKKSNETPQEKFDEMAITLIDGFKSLLNEINVPQAIQEIIIAYAGPHINKFVINLTQTFEKKINELFQF